jgi:hypothetical protein
MAAKLKLIPGSTIRWGGRRFVVVDYVGLDAVIAREVGQRKLERSPVRVANPDRTPGDADTIRQRVAALPDRLKLEKRKNRKAAAERYEPIKGHFPGAGSEIKLVVLLEADE